MTTHGPSRRSSLIGLLLAIIGAVGFASKGVFAKALYADGWSVDSVLVLRALYALPCMAIWTALTQGTIALTRVNPRAIAWTAFAGIDLGFQGPTVNRRQR